MKLELGGGGGGSLSFGEVKLELLCVCLFVFFWGGGGGLELWGEASPPLWSAMHLSIQEFHQKGGKYEKKRGGGGTEAQCEAQKCKGGEIRP